jgi:hypothetical protein
MRTLLGLLFLLHFHTFATESLNWPPVKGGDFTNMKMIDATGKTVEMKSLKGQVLLVELAAMTCAGCQAFSGGNKVGGLGSTMPQKDLKSVEEYLPEWSGGVKITDPRLKFIQVLFYNEKMQAPTAADVAKWAKHFKLEGRVYGATKEYTGGSTNAMIPGFYLVDKNFKVVADSCGHFPKDNLYSGLMPKIKKLLE